MATLTQNSQPQTRPRFHENPNYIARKPKTDSLILVGYLTALVAIIILPIPCAIAGISCGFINLSRGREFHGIMQIILNATCGIFGTMLGYMAITGQRF